MLSDYRVYGELERGLVISENEAGFVPFSNNGDMSQTTAVSIETYFSAYAKQFNLPTIILRSGILLGAKAELPQNFTDELLVQLQRVNKFHCLIHAKNIHSHI